MVTVLVEEAAVAIEDVVDVVVDEELVVVWLLSATRKTNTQFFKRKQPNLTAKVLELIKFLLTLGCLQLEINLCCLQ